MFQLTYLVILSSHVNDISSVKNSICVCPQGEVIGLAKTFQLKYRHKNFSCAFFVPKFITETIFTVIMPLLLTKVMLILLALRCGPKRGCLELLLFLFNGVHP